MPAPPTVRSRPLHRCDHSRPGHRRVQGAGVGEPGHRRTGRQPTLPHRVGQGDKVVLVGVGRQGCRVAHQLPAAGSGDPAGVCDAEVPGMRLADGRQRPHHGGGVGVDVRQRRHRILGAPGPAAATGNIHAGEAIAVDCRVTPDTRGGQASRCPTVTICSPWPIPAVRGAAAGRAAVPGAAGTCAARCFRRPFRVGAAARSASTWRCSRPMNR